jgi:hypothetical protein
MEVQPSVLWSYSKRCALIWASLTAGNFLYEAVDSCRWHVVAEHSFVQFVAIFAVWLAVGPQWGCSSATGDQADSSPGDHLEHNQPKQ